MVYGVRFIDQNFIYILLPLGVCNFEIIYSFAYQPKDKIKQVPVIITEKPLLEFLPI